MVSESLKLTCKLLTAFKLVIIVAYNLLAFGSVTSFFRFKGEKTTRRVCVKIFLGV